jgi:hypothetical protein
VTGLLAWLEASALGEAVRGAGIWSYAVLNLIHILGVATLFGSILILDLRMLGAFRRTPLALISIPTVRLAAAGFTIAALSGMCLLATNASEYASNPFLSLKFAAIFVGLANVLILRAMPVWHQRYADTLSRRQRTQLALSGGISLAAWTTALSAGRMLGYW